MHVLFVPNAYPNAQYPYRGVFFKDLVVALKKAGVKVGVAYLDIRPFVEQDLKVNPIKIDHLDGYPVVSKRGYNRIPLGSHYQRKIYEKVISNVVNKYVKEFGQPDLIHAHVGLWAGWATSEYCRKHHMNYVLTEHSSAVLGHTIPKTDRTYLTLSYDRANGLFAVSKALSIAMGRYSKRPVSVVPNAVDIAFFAGSDGSNKVKTEGFVTVATLDDNKGVDLMIRAIGKLNKTGTKAKLDIVGDGPSLNSFRSLVTQLELDGDIHFHGRIPKKEIKKLLQRSKVFISASKQETFGVAIVEAMAAGLPVITTRSGGPESIVKDGTGIFSDRSVNGLTEKMKWMLENPDKFNSAEITSHVMNRYSSETVADLYLDHYQKIVGFE